MPETRILRKIQSNKEQKHNFRGSLRISIKHRQRLRKNDVTGFSNKSVCLLKDKYIIEQKKDLNACINIIKDIYPIVNYHCDLSDAKFTEDTHPYEFLLWLMDKLRFRFNDSYNIRWNDAEDKYELVSENILYQPGWGQGFFVGWIPEMEKKNPQLYKCLILFLAVMKGLGYEDIVGLDYWILEVENEDLKEQLLNKDLTRDEYRDARNNLKYYLNKNSPVRKFFKMINNIKGDVRQKLAEEVKKLDRNNPYDKKFIMIHNLLTKVPESFHLSKYPNFLDEEERNIETLFTILWTNDYAQICINRMSQGDFENDHLPYLVKYVFLEEAPAETFIDDTKEFIALINKVFNNFHWLEHGTFAT